MPDNRMHDGNGSATLEALFDRALQQPPSPAQLTQMLRGVRGVARSHRRVWATLGAVASGVTAVVAMALLLAGPDQPRAFAINQVAEAMRQVPLVKLRTADGGTVWEGRGRFYAYVTEDGSRAIYKDLIKLESADYDARRKCIMLTACEPLPSIPSLAGLVTLEDLVNAAEPWGRSYEDYWDTREVTRDGRHLIALSPKQSVTYSRQSTYFIDPATGLIAAVDWHSGTTLYEYPSHGPKDIYDLGAPRDLPVVDGRPSRELMELRERVMAATKRGFGAYHLVLVEASGGQGLRRITTDGWRMRVEVDRLPYDQRWTLNELQAMAAEAIRDPLAPGNQRRGVSDGTTDTMVSIDEAGAFHFRHERPAQGAALIQQTLEVVAYGWREGFFHIWTDHQYEYLPRNERGWLGYRLLSQASECTRPNVVERWYDPARAHCLCGGRRLEDPAANWQLDPNWPEIYNAYESWVAADDPPMRTLWRILEWGELRPGQWYPSVSESRHEVQDDDGSWVLHERPDFVGYQPLSWRVALAVPLDEVKDEWFEVPAEWRDVPTPASLRSPDDNRRP
jgi:hypothetical protein